MRTSLTHPIRIAEISPAPSLGKVGLTFCPGKVQSDALTGAWQRDLMLDMDEIARWGAAAVVTLVEAHELETLQVTGIEPAVRQRHMSWYHLPIQDVSIPTHEFEDAWALAGEQLRSLLRSGFSVLVHCKGGLGRAGLVAARLLIELGMAPELAVKAVRQVRPGAIQTSAQLRYVMALHSAAEPEPDRTPEGRADRAAGALLGLAIGDAVGTTLEFNARDSCSQLTDMVGGGPFRLQAGQWTDDTSMALALADSLLANPDLDPADLMARFVRWHETGEYSCTGRCFDIGNTVRAALGRFKQSGEPLSGSTDPQSAGNGSLMRLAPVAIRHWRDPEALRKVTALQSRTTHGAPEAVDACIAYAQVLASAILGADRSEVLGPRLGPYAEKITAIMGGGWRGKHRDQIRASGYVAHSLEAALWSVGRTTTFADAVLMAANLGEDADTTAAIAGQLAGALYGMSGIPQKWLQRVAWGEEIRRKAYELFHRS